MGSDKRHISRREYLQSGTLGLSLPGIAAVPEGLAKDPVKLPFLRRGDSIVSCYEAPRRWHEQNERAKRILESNRGKNDANVVGSGLGSSEKRFDGWRGRKIDYYVRNKSKFDAPNEIDGVQVTVSQSKKFRDLQCDKACYNDEQYTTIPGGAVWGLDGTVTGTACARALYDDEDYILTANHVMRTSGCTDTVGNTATQCGNTVGDVDVSNKAEDWALVRDTYISSGNSIDNTDYRHDLKGHVTQSGLDYLDCHREDIHKVGSASGVTASDIINTNYDHVNGCRDFDYNGLLTNIDSTDGDSGGPVYWVDGNDDAWLCSILTQGSTNDTGYDRCGSDVTEESLGISAEHLFFKHDIKFGMGFETTTSYNSCP